jgi:hypothetical protein
MAFQPPRFRALTQADFPLGDALREAMQAYQQAKLGAARRDVLGEQQNLYKAQEAKARAEADKQAALNEVLRNYLMPKKDQQAAASQAAQTAPQQPQIPGITPQQALINKMIFGEAESPQQKAQREIETFRQKKEMAARLPTQRTLSQFQQRLPQVRPFIKGIDDLISAPSPVEVSLKGMQFYLPDAVAKHKALVKNLVDTYLAVRGLPATEGNIQLASTILDRHGMESDAAYRRRLKEERRRTVGAMKNIYDLTKQDVPDDIQRFMHTINDPDVIATAKKYKMQPEEVIELLEKKNAR